MDDVNGTVCPHCKEPLQAGESACADKKACAEQARSVMERITKGLLGTGPGPDLPDAPQIREIAFQSLPPELTAAVAAALGAALAGRRSQGPVTTLQVPLIQGNPAKQAELAYHEASRLACCILHGVEGMAREQAAWSVHSYERFLEAEGRTLDPEEERVLRQQAEEWFARLVETNPTDGRRTLVVITTALVKFMRRLQADETLYGDPVPRK